MNTTHRCTEKECPFVGQVTSKSCGCHKTAEQMLKERVTELSDVLSEILDYRGGAESALHDEYVMDRAWTALANASAGA